MNLLEAIKSGKPFRRKDFPNDYWLDFDDAGILRNDCAHKAYMQTKEAFLDEFETQESEIIITEKQFDEAWDKVINSENAQTGILLKKELGFK
jgi:hypothetical protein